jgi:DnaJ like chaperone protein
MFAGKLVAAILGYFVAGVPGLLVGVLLGHLFDRGLAGALGFGGANLGEIRQQFFRITVRLMGYIAKADGRVSEEEIAHTEQVFRQLGLDDEQRNEAILLFKEGADSSFSVERAVREFLQAGGGHPALKQNLMMFLLTLALADSQLHPDEHDALRLIGGLLGYSPHAVEDLLRMATAQEQFHRHPGAATAGPSLADAYAALGVESSVSDAEIKRAYRKLMSQNHPDKLSSRGVPDEMLKLATERSQEIQAAYELVRNSRGTGRSG